MLYVPEAHALAVDEDLRIAARVRDVRELTAGAERGCV